MALPGSAKYMIICMNGNRRRSSFHLESWNIFNIYLGFKYILYLGEAFCLQPKPEEFQRLIVISANPLWHLEIAFDKFPCTHQGLDSTPGILPLQNTNTRRIFILWMKHSKRLGEYLSDANTSNTFHRSEGCSARMTLKNKLFLSTFVTLVL